MSEYVKLSDLVGSDFTVEKVFGFSYKLWDNENKKMLTSDVWVKDYRKVYGLATDKGNLDISAHQFGNMLEGVSKGGQADVVGKTYDVKSNGKTGMEIRYYINPARENKESDNKPVTDNDIENIENLFG